MSTTASRVALVTGAGGGLGPACVARLVGDGFHVVGADLNADALAVLADDVPGIETAGADVTSGAEADGLVEGIRDRHGRLDAVVNLAGVIRNAVITRITDEDFGMVMATHVTGTLHMMRAAGSVMRAQQSGRIVNMSSIAVKGSLAGGSYGAAKGAVEGLTRAAAIDLARHGITVNCVAPGVIASGMFLTTPKEYQDEILRRHPMGRLGAPEDVAAAVSFFCGPDSAYVTGQSLFVCGGLSLGF